jgi:hypothetical protein
MALTHASALWERKIGPLVEVIDRTSTCCLMRPIRHGVHPAARLGWRFLLDVAIASDLWTGTCELDDAFAGRRGAGLSHVLGGTGSLAGGGGRRQGDMSRPDEGRWPTGVATQPPATAPAGVQVRFDALLRYAPIIITCNARRASRHQRSLSKA